MFILPLEASEPEIVELYTYWLGKAPAGKLPGRQHIDPVEFSPRLLPHVLLLDVERSDPAPRFRFRVAGTAFVDLIGREVRGRCYDEIAAPERVEPVCGALRKIAETGSPVFLEGPLTVPSRDFVWVKRLGLPLARDGENVDMILAAFHPVPKRREFAVPASSAASPFSAVS
jgi:hypothetical protein